MRHSLILLATAFVGFGTVAATAQTEWAPPPQVYAPSHGSDMIPPPGVHADFDDSAGYWVIVGSVPTADAAAWQRQGLAVRTKASACGLDPFDDYSDNFIGFRPGYNVFVVGPFASTQEANGVRNVARRCIPDSYVKYGEYVQG